jgi:hypothetical protein
MRAALLAAALLLVLPAGATAAPELVRVGDYALAISAASSFGEDACGHVYVASLSGPVYRLQDGAAARASLEPLTAKGGGTTASSSHRLSANPSASHP